MERILIVEDEHKISRIIELQLKHAGYETDTAFDGSEAIVKVSLNKYALILMDVMMPKTDGITACNAIKKINPEAKIIMLTAKDDIQDVINGLDSGADDYVTKPFVFDELLARIRANIRKKSEPSTSSDLLSFEDVLINSVTFEVTRSGKLIELSKTEFDLLRHLMINKGIVLTREQILNKVWGYDYYGSLNIVDVYIKYLRDKIDRDYERKLIQTIRGRGYVVR
ncbi:response regulator transcription factor [Fusibacter bizertensis]|uniref:Stage 0 sporulation protein A homolog n=1 Tax=Fusibacter bizertensis TaxID=1488331 RepID=A0ABT6NA13_9FIRM|nr:response regulator transcription factor [Fusibacter bizertensis]MDH8677247.1 response regulator transcription factor [Fusibacter bizertensis]